MPSISHLPNKYRYGRYGDKIDEVEEVMDRIGKVLIISTSKKQQANKSDNQEVKPHKNTTFKRITSLIASYLHRWS